jgi:hypothetical protein
MTNRDAHLLWFLEQRGAFWFDAEEPEQGPRQPSKSAIIIPFRRLRSLDPNAGKAAHTQIRL